MTTVRRSGLSVSQRWHDAFVNDGVHSAGKSHEPVVEVREQFLDFLLLQSPNSMRLLNGRYGQEGEDRMHRPLHIVPQESTKGALIESVHSCLSGKVVSHLEEGLDVLPTVTFVARRRHDDCHVPTCPQMAIG